jgi:hypothetical protein
MGRISIRAGRGLMERKVPSEFRKLGKGTNPFPVIPIEAGRGSMGTKVFGMPFTKEIAMNEALDNMIPLGI